MAISYLVAVACPWRVSLSQCTSCLFPHPPLPPPPLSPTTPSKLRGSWRSCFFIRAGLVVFSYCQAHFYPAAWTCVPVCWDDVDHVAERIHRVPQLAGHVCLPCCHGRDVHLRLLCAGLCPRCRRRGGNHFLLLGRCVSAGPSIL